MLDCVLSAYFVMARIAIHKMNLARAHTLLEWAENQGNTRGWGRLSAAAVFERVRLCLNEGRIDEGVEHLNRLDRLAMQYPAPANCAWSDIHRYATFGRAYAATAQGRFDDAISILTGLRRELENVHNRLLALRVEVLTAAVTFRMKRVAEAVEFFGRIVAVSAKAGIYHTIVDEGAVIGPLLLAVPGDRRASGRFWRTYTLRVQRRCGVAPPLRIRAAAATSNEFFDCRSVEPTRRRHTQTDRRWSL